MARHFLHVGFDFAEEPNLEELEKTFDKGLDWYRYSSNCWLVWTSSSPDRWYTRLKKHLKSGDIVFICEVRIDERSGWMPKKFWNFVKSHQHATS